MHSPIQKQMLEDDRREVIVDFFQGSTITGSDGPTGPNAAKFGSHYKYMNTAALSKRNEITTLVSSKAFKGQCTACRVGGGGGVQCVCMIVFPFNYTCIEYPPRPSPGITLNVHLYCQVLCTELTCTNIAIYILHVYPF